MAIDHLIEWSKIKIKSILDFFMGKSHIENFKTKSEPHKVSFYGRLLSVACKHFDLLFRTGGPITFTSKLGTKYIHGWNGTEVFTN